MWFKHCYVYAWLQQTSTVQDVLHRTDEYEVSYEGWNFN